MRTLESYDPTEVAEGRKRVAKGAEFFNDHFPGWQQRIIAEETTLYMESHDMCAAAIAARHRVGPSGYTIYSHGDVCREYPQFDIGTAAFGCRVDGTLGGEILALCWIEAAKTVPEKPLKRGWLQRIRDRARLREAQLYENPTAELAY
jgi:hypothetical protein